MIAALLAMGSRSPDSKPSDTEEQTEDASTTGDTAPPDEPVIPWREAGAPTLAPPDFTGWTDGAPAVALPAFDCPEGWRAISDDDVGMVCDPWPDGGRHPGTVRAALPPSEDPYGVPLNVDGTVATVRRADIESSGVAGILVTVAGALEAEDLRVTGFGCLGGMAIDAYGGVTTLSDLNLEAATGATGFEGRGIRVSGNAAGGHLRDCRLFGRHGHARTRAPGWRGGGRLAGGRMGVRRADVASVANAVGINVVGGTLCETRVEATGNATDRSTEALPHPG